MPRQSIAKEEIALAKLEDEATEFQIIGLSAAGKTTREIGKSTGWDQKKVVKFLGVPENAKKVAGAKKALLEAVNATLITTGKKAATKLAFLMDDKDPSVALNAAKITLDNIAKITAGLSPSNKEGGSVALQVNIGNQEATKIVSSELRKYHNR